MDHPLDGFDQLPISAHGGEGYWRIWEKEREGILDIMIKAGNVETLKPLKYTF